MNEYNKMTEYNGYTNKPTWLVHLWMTNDSSSNEFWEERASEYIKDNEEGLGALYGFCNEMKDYFEDETYPFEEGSVFSDLLSFSLAYVNWREIGESFFEAAKETEA